MNDDDGKVERLNAALTRDFIVFQFRVIRGLSREQNVPLVRYFPRT